MAEKPQYTYAMLNLVSMCRLKALKQLELIERLETAICRELEVTPRPPILEKKRRRI